MSSLEEISASGWSPVDSVMMRRRTPNVEFVHVTSENYLSVIEWVKSRESLSPIGTIIKPEGSPTALFSIAHDGVHVYVYADSMLGVRPMFDESLGYSNSLEFFCVASAMLDADYEKVVS